MSSSSSPGDRSRRRIAVCYCATFLKPEMLHIYRQLGAISKFQVQVLTQKREGNFPFPHVTVVPRSPWRWLQRIVYRQWLRRPVPLTRGEMRAIRAYLLSTAPRVVHVIFGHAAVQLLPVLKARDRRWPVVVSFHGADVLVELDQPAHRAATLDMLGRVDLVLARSQSLASALMELGCPAEKIRLNRTGIPLEAFPFRARAWPEDGRWRIMQACRLIEKKGLTTTLRAFQAFSRQWPESTLLIAGEGPQETQLRRLAQELGIAARVEFAGFLEQDALRARFYEAHLFVHPSERGADGNQEGVPNSLLEAMATGLPVVATHHGGIPEAVTHGVSGWLVPERDAPALGAALCELASDPARLSALAEAGAKSVAGNFESAAQAAKLQGYYDEAIQESLELSIRAAQGGEITEPGVGKLA